MALETTQLLTTAVFKLGLDPCNGYKPTHQNHPCTVWTMATRGNLDWVIEHGEALFAEYTFRYGKKHKSYGPFVATHKYASYIRGDLTPFVNVTGPFSYMGSTRVVEAYKEYMIYKWREDKRPPKWTNRGAPQWANCYGFY